MTKNQRHLLVQEVQELTAIFRDDPALTDLREQLKRSQLDPDNCMLAGLIESEDGMEYGVIVAPDGTAIEYERRVGIRKTSPRLVCWHEVQDINRLAADSFPALAVGIELVRAERGAADDLVIRAVDDSLK